ncbi:MAG: hypothetical protein FD149_2331, partial [Rhodospirillaceae bacterium]
YTRPRSLEEMVDYTVGRTLSLFGLEVDLPQWGDP